MKVAYITLIVSIFTLQISSPVFAVTQNPEHLQIVDCLLPGKVKQLGLKRVYVSKKRPKKITANECAIRGGEYVLSDRATRESSLKVWLEQANLGDKIAQYYVGEIYERGFGQAPDYELARVWYKKSAEQDYDPAKISLGRLYESGLGVEKDLLAAINLYRDASGLGEEEIAFASAFREQIAQGQAKIKDLESTLEKTRAARQRLEQQVQSLREELAIQQQQTQQINTGIQQTEKALSSAREAVKSVPSELKSHEEIVALNQQLLDANQQLTKKQQLITALQSELELAKAGEETKAFLTQRLNEAQNNLTQAEQKEQQSQQQIQQLKARLSKVKQRLSELVPRQQLAHLEKELNEQQTLAKEQLAKEKARIREQDEYIEALNESLKAAKKEKNDSVLAIQYQLVNAQSELEKMQSAMARKDNQVQQLKKEMALLQETAQQSKTQEKSEISKEAINAVVQSILQQKAEYIETSTQGLKAELKAAQDNVAILNERLSKNKALQASQKNYIAELEKEIQAIKSNIAGSKDNVKEKEIQLMAAQEKIKSLQTQLQAYPKQIEKLEAQLEKQKIRLSTQQSKVSELNVNLAALDAEKENMQLKFAQLSLSEDPVITIRWPSIHSSEKDGIASAEVLAGSVINVVGAVYPHKLIETFTINGETENLDNSGLFLKTVEVSDKPITLNLLAVDEEGRKTEKQLTLQPSTELKVNALQAQNARPTIDFGKFYALIISNSQYDQDSGWEPLVTPQQDAEDLAKILREKYDFEVKIASNVTREEMLIALEEMRKKLTDKDNLLIYYAGHGYVDPENGQGYWIPVDGKLDSSVQWVSNTSITDQIRAMSARNIMIVSDSCYSGSLMRSGLVQLRSGLPVEKRLKRLRDDVRAITRVAFTSGGLQPVADSIGNSRHSVFAGALISILQNNQQLLDGQALATEVGVRVATMTADSIKQVPRYAPLVHGGHEGGEFYFAPVK